MITFLSATYGWFASLESTEFCNTDNMINTSYYIEASVLNSSCGKHYRHRSLNGSFEKKGGIPSWEKFNFIGSAEFLPMMDLWDSQYTYSSTRTVSRLKAEIKHVRLGGKGRDGNDPTERFSICSGGWERIGIFHAERGRQSIGRDASWISHTVQILNCFPQMSRARNLRVFNLK